jgi:hypothetical protein
VSNDQPGRFEQRRDRIVVNPLAGDIGIGDTRQPGDLVGQRKARIFEEHQRGSDLVDRSRFAPVGERHQRQLNDTVRCCRQSGGLDIKRQRQGHRLGAGCMVVGCCPQPAQHAIVTAGFKHGDLFFERDGFVLHRYIAVAARICVLHLRCFTLFIGSRLAG